MTVESGFSFFSSTSPLQGGVGCGLGMSGRSLFKTHPRHPISKDTRLRVNRQRLEERMNETIRESGGECGKTVSILWIDLQD